LPVRGYNRVDPAIAKRLAAGAPSSGTIAASTQRTGIKRPLLQQSNAMTG